MDDTYTAALKYRFGDNGGVETSPVKILEHVFDVHYRVIASHDDIAICGGRDSAIYTASEDLVVALMVRAYGIDHETAAGRLLDLVYESGEVPSSPADAQRWLDM